MDLADLRIFVRAAELGSFSKAAVALGVAQPTVSRIIGELETKWDGSLFYRTGRGVTLSELGQEALGKARHLLREFERVTEDLKAFSRLPSGVVSIGIPPSIVGRVIPELLIQLRAELPGIKLQIYEGFGDQIERGLSEGSLDIGIYSKYHEGARGTDRLLVQSQLVLVGASGGWEIPPEIMFERLSEYPLILPPPANGLRVIIDSIARRLKVSLKVIADADSYLVQREMALQCGCFMIKAPHTISEDIERGLLSTSVIREPYINRHIVLVSGTQRPPSRACSEIATRMTAILRTYALPLGSEPQKEI